MPQRNRLAFAAPSCKLQFCQKGSGFQGSGCKGLGFKGSGFKGLGLKDLGFKGIDAFLRAVALRFISGTSPHSISLTSQIGPRSRQP